MNGGFDDLAKGLGQATTRRRALRKLGIVLAGAAVVCVGSGTARADWTPPESSVTPPAVVTLDAFSAPDTGGYTNQGFYPLAALVVGSDGALYGSTQKGGAGSSGFPGRLFRLETNGNFTQLHVFNGTDGYQPSVALVLGPDGALYGSTQTGGTNNNGTLFRVKPDGTFAKLLDFNNDGPSAPLVMGPDGALYGSADRTLFRVETNGTFTKLHEFNGTDGYQPSVPLVVGPDGALYGSSYVGGTNLYQYGTLFRVETNGTFTKLHDFNGRDGYHPATALVVGPDGALYGSTQDGGTNFYGTLFRLETNGTFTNLHNFGGADGASPLTALVVGPDGALYGSTQYGGTNAAGNLFRLQTNGTFTRLHDFGGKDGAHPLTALVVGPDAALYGSTAYGGTNFDGTLFRLETNGTFTKLHDFRGTNGVNPSAALVLGPDGALYGSTTRGGGPFRRGGILFKLVLNRPPVPRCHDVSVSAGANCSSDASVDDGSFDPDAADTITLRQEPPGPYPLGTTPVTLTVTDNHGASASCTATVTVMDITPPTINDAAVTPNVLWPPNGKMVEVAVDYTATDDCGAVTNVLSVTSNEAHNGTMPDWVIEDSHHVQLRAERSGARAGRVYAITVISTDSAGNSSTKTITVAVLKNQK